MAYGYGRQGYNDNPGMQMLQGVQMLGNAMHQGQQLQEQRMRMEDQQGVNAAYEHIAQKVGSSGDISTLDGDPLMNTRHGTMAAGRFFKERANTETSRLQMLKSMEAGDDHFYQKTFRPMAFAAQEAFQKGDMQRFGVIANELSAKSPLPYQIEPTQDGNFRVRFRSSADGGWVDTGQTMTPQEVMGQIGGIIGGEQKVLAGADMQTRIVNPRYLAAAARYRMGTIQSNAEALADPKQWIPLTKGGHTVWAVAQNRHDDYSAAPVYRIVDDRGKMSGTVPNLDALLQQGWGRGDVKAQLAKMQRAGQGRSGTGGAGVQLAQGDRSMLLKYATTDDGVGNEKVDYRKAALLEGFIQKTGLIPMYAIAAFEENVGRAMAKGATKEQAEQLVMTEMAQSISGGVPGRMQKTDAGQAPAAQQPTPSQQKLLQGILGPVNDTSAPQQPQGKRWNEKTIYDFFDEFNSGLKNYKPDLPAGY